ncbi:carbohydrate porin [Acidithiobacillus caldus]|uniref:carbohydrate porin n=1 Tax=Acidithiobacillus caldus TaxID=33059 RepID=UPI0034A5AAD9
MELDHSGSLGIGSYTLKVGGFHNQQKSDLAATLGPTTSGFYGIGEYRWKINGYHYGAFLVGGGAPEPINLVPWYVGGGIKLAGYFADEPKDALSIGFSRASLRGLPNAETSYEITNTFRITSGVTMQPDLQVVMHPGGNLPMALVGIIRITMNLVKIAKS